MSEKDYHAETYIVDIEREDGEMTIRVRRNEGRWYEEEYRVIAEPPSIDLISGVIGDDFRRRADG